MDTNIQEDEPTANQKEERFRYWLAKTPAEREAETWRLSVEKYGEPKGSLRDGPYRMIHKTATGELTGVEWTLQPPTVADTSCDTTPQPRIWQSRILSPDEISS